MTTQQKVYAAVATFLIAVLGALGWHAVDSAGHTVVIGADLTNVTTTTTVGTGGGTTTSTAPSTTQPAVPTTSTTVTVPPAPHTNYAFVDEFNGTGLDTTLWQPNWLGSSNSQITKPINGAEASCYDPAQVSVTGGNLVLTAAQRSCKASNGTTYGWASGIVTSHNSFTFKTGTLTARVWTPGTSAMTDWPAAWTDGTGSWPQTGESDIMEGLSGKACWHYHSPSGGPGGCVGALTGWHTYAETVTASKVTYSYDGAVVGSETPVNAPHYIILNLGVGGYGGANSADKMMVDWIRVTVP